MKRAFPQKVKPVSHRVDLMVEVMEQPKQAPQGASRRARTSAAMLGLALSMGASSVLLPRHTDGAAAAESRLSESVLAAESAAQAAISEAKQEEPSAHVLEAPPVEHTVRSGQTLWYIARQYQVSVDELVALNGIDASATLKVGQTLKIPATAHALRVADALKVEPVVPRATTKADGEVSGSLERQASEQSSTAPEDKLSLDRLREARERLRQSLAELQNAEQDVEAPAIASVDKRIESPAEPPRVAASESTAKPVAGSLVADEAATYRVKPGDTLGAIADAHDVSTQALAMANRLENPNQLRVNQSLTIPSPSALESSVSAGSTLITATLRGVQPQLPSIVPGRMPAEVEPDSPRPSASTVYRVTAGDTIAQIARRYNISSADLIAANRLRNPNVIRVGETLRIPGASSLNRAMSQSSASEVIHAAAQPRSEVQLSAALPLTEGSSFQITPPSASTEAVVPTVIPTPEVSEETTFLSDRVQPEVAAPTAGASSAMAPAVEASPAVEAQSPARFQSATFVARLVSEVDSLSDRTPHASVASQTELPAVVAASRRSVVTSATSVAEASRVNPQLLSASADSAELQSPGFQRQLNREADRASTLAGDAVAANQSQVVAAAPLGAENYAPLLEPVVGRMVSPDLPPLPGAEHFLPESSPIFNGYIWPARGVLTSGYGWRWGRMHRGLDIAAPVGTPIHAAAPGVVQFSGWNSGGYGNMVEIRHADGSMTRYAHNSRNLVRVGQRVEQGQQIALMGSTGFSTGPHVHFEVHLPNQGTVNPVALLPRRGQ